MSEMDSGADSAIDAEPMPAPSLSVDKRALTLIGAAGAASAPGVLTLTNEGDAPLNIEAKFASGTGGCCDAFFGGRRRHLSHRH